MAQTAGQWNDKIEKFVPGWTHESSGVISPAVWLAIATLFAAIQQDGDDQQQATFIMHATAPVLDLIGAERSIIRSTGESDANYRIRVQNGLFTPVGGAEIQSLVNAVLNNGPGFFIENSQYGFFDDTDQEFFYDDPSGLVRWLNHKKWYNWWSLVVPIQVAGDENAIRAAIVAVIEANKAFGTTYDILYRSVSDTDPND